MQQIYIENNYKSHYVENDIMQLSITHQARYSLGHLRLFAGKQ